MDFLDHALREAAPYLDRYGYLAVFAAVFLEGVGIPAPGVTLLVAAAFAAGRGAMQLPVLMATALAAALLGFNGGYWLGYAAGRGLLRQVAWFNERHFERLHRLFGRWGMAVVVVAPFLDGLRQLNGYAAGLAEMRWRRYALANLIGVVLWIALWSLLAYAASLHARWLYRALHVGHAGWYAGASVVAVALVVYLLWRRKRQQGRDPGGPA